MGDTIAQTRFENVSKLSNDSLLARGNTLQSDKDRLKLNEFMELCTTLQKKVLDLEKTKTTQANKIASLKRRVKKLKKKRSSRTHKLKRLYKVDKDITMVNVQDDADKEIYDVGTVIGDEVFAEQEVVAKDVNVTVDEVTLAQALTALKSVKPKVKGDVIEEPNVPTNDASASTKVSAATTTATIRTPRKGIVITELGTPTITRSSQQPSQAEVQDKGKGKMIEPEPVKKMSKKDQLRSDEEETKRLKAEFDEEERLAREKDKANQRRKHFATKSTEEKRNKPPTQAQQRKIICTYLKNMEGKKLKDLKNKSFNSIQKMFDRAFKRVNTFVNFRTDLVEDDEEVAIDVVPLATKPPTIVDFFSQLLKSVDREDLVELYKLVKAKYGSTRPVEDIDLLLWGDLKTMFEPHVEDEIWKLQQRVNVAQLYMDQDSAHMVAASKVPMLKPGEFELWRMRIEQYIQMIDYALWEVIENGATLPKTTVVEGVKK
ncbi:hypothetical protein Tco_0002364 [Tanacetum coccineum]